MSHRTTAAPAYVRIERFAVESNGCGGWECLDRLDAHRAVASSAFYEFADKAARRLNYGEPGDEWRRYYGVRD